MSRNFTYFTTISYIILILFTIVYAEQCVQKSPCSCEFDDGREIDLHKLAATKNFIQTTTLNNLTYFFHPCTDAEPTIPKSLIPINVTINNQCKSTSVCLLNLTDHTAKSLGQAKDAKILPISNSEIYNILFTSNKLTTIIVLACSNYPDPVLDIKQGDPNTHNLIFFSPQNCPFTEYTGLSTGSVLVILLFVFTLIYLFGGAIVLHFLRGARGREMIPNIDFWTDFPILVKDGAVFLQNGCKPVVLSTSESYDRI